MPFCVHALDPSHSQAIAFNVFENIALDKLVAVFRLLVQPLHKGFRANL